MEKITDSKHIAGVDWNNGVLTIQFTSGDTYEYYDVPIGIKYELLQSEQKSLFFRTVIKGNYQYAKV